MPNVIILIVTNKPFMLSVFMLSVVMLNIVAPFKQYKNLVNAIKYLHVQFTPTYCLRESEESGSTN
jgi:hypothetical protein